MLPDEILLSLRERIVAFAASRIGKDVAEDLAQEVLIVLHEKYSHVTRPEELLPLALQIIRFKMMAQRRKSVRRGEYTQVSITDIQLPDLDSDPARLRRAKEMLEKLTKAIAQLGDRCRRDVPAETAGQEFRGDPEDHGSGVHQYHLHLGFPLP